MSIKQLRNVAIIAHVDHGKTTLVDKLLQQSGTLDRKNMDSERVMDSDDQEKERGITILAKNTAIKWKDHRINIVDTPGHADFGGEVERVLSMVDSVLLLVDAVDGPMPQTRFVTQKAFDQGLNPILVINKIDRPGARPDWVLDQVFDLFDRLGGNDEQLDFPVIYASALNGVAGLDEDEMANDMSPLMDLILEKVSPPEVNDEGPLQMQISALDYNSYVGVIGIGRITRGKIKPNEQVIVVGSGFLQAVIATATIAVIAASRIPVRFIIVPPWGRFTPRLADLVRLCSSSVWFFSSRMRRRGLRRVAVWRSVLLFCAQKWSVHRCRQPLNGHAKWRPFGMSQERSVRSVILG